jgi:hypothetical protein
MGNALEIEARRLKRRFGADYHEQIDRNLQWVSEEMDSKPGGVALQEGLIGLSRGLPSEASPVKQARAKPNKVRKLSRQ